MPRAYSTDLRERALAAYEAREGSQAAVARRFRAGERTLSRWLGAARAEGRRAPKPRGGGRAPLGGEAATLAALVAERDDATLAEHADLLAERAGVRRSAPASGAASRPCAGRSGRSASSARKGAPGRRAGAGGRGRAAGGVARRAGGDRPWPLGLRRRDRDRHPDDAGG